MVPYSLKDRATWLKIDEKLLQKQLKKWQTQKECSTEAPFVRIQRKKRLSVYMKMEC